MTEQLTIARIGHRGDGIADTNVGPVYVPYTLPGETVTVERVAGHPDRRHLIHVDKPSHERETPICKHFGVCGGCAMQHWSLAEYHLWKRSLVIEALAHANVIAPVGESDRRARPRAAAARCCMRGAAATACWKSASRAPRAHQIVAIDRCPILAPGLDGAVAAAWAIAEILAPKNKPLDIHVTATDTGMDVDVRGSGPINSKSTTALAALAAKHKLARITRHSELVSQNSQPLLKVGTAHVPLPPAAFLQATAEGEAALARLVIGHVGAAKCVADLFSGIGTFALRLAERARVSAADNEAGAIKALERAATKTPGLKPVEAQTRDLFRRPFMAMDLKVFDAVVFDRRARARKRRRTNWPEAKCRSSSRCHATWRLSPMTPVFWSMAATSS